MGFLNPLGRTTNLLAIIMVIALSINFIMPLTVYAQTYPRQESLYYGTTWLSNNFNPFSWDACVETTILYPPLFVYDPASNSILPFIAEKYEWINKTALKIKIRNEAKWSDGQPITTDDVLFSWNLGIELGISGGAEEYYELKKLNDKEFIVVIKKPNYVYLFTAVLLMVPVPKHAWEPIYEQYKKSGEDFMSWPNNDPEKMVVSGPYKLKSFVEESSMVLERIDNWWGKDVFGLPRPKYIVVIYYKSTSAEAMAFQSGEIDIFSEASTNLESMLHELKDAGSWYSERPYVPFWGIWCLFINYHKYPLNDPVLRRAIAYVIPYDDIIEKALGFTSIRTPEMYALLGPQWKEYFNETLAKKYWGSEMMPVYDPEKAKQILREAGYYWKDGILYTPNGTPVGTPDKPLEAIIPEGWEDSDISLQLIVQHLRDDLGIQVELRLVDEDVWWESLIKGEFDFTESDPGGIPICYPPWFIYMAVMDPRQIKPIGEEADYNWERYNNPEVANILEEIATNYFNEEIVKKDYSKLQEIFMRDLPVIPLDYGQYWYAYREIYWTNFPNENNAYWGAFCTWAGGTFTLPILFALTPKGETPNTPSWITEWKIPLTKFYEGALGITTPSSTTTSTKTTTISTQTTTTITTTTSTKTSTTPSSTTTSSTSPSKTATAPISTTLAIVIIIIIIIVALALLFLKKKH